MTRVKIGLIGYSGKVCSIIRTIRSFSIPKGEFELEYCDVFQDGSADVVIDFSRPEATVEYLSKFPSKCPLIIGTTGYTEDEIGLIESAAQGRFVLMASNFSIGIFRLNQYLSQISADFDWDCEIVEEHHNQKVDAPSGTAITLGQTVANARGQSLKDVRRDASRYTQKTSREQGEIGFSSIRCGGTVGRHNVIFDSGRERIEISHTAHSREIFASDAINIAIKILFQDMLEFGKIYCLNDIL